MKGQTNISSKKEVARSSRKQSWHEARLDGLMEDNYPVPDIAPTLPSKQQRMTRWPSKVLPKI